MKRMRSVSIVCCAALCGAAALFAQEPGGIRASGMGRAFTAVAGDIDAIYHNPAGLAAVIDPELNLNFGSAYGPGGAGYLGGALLALPLGSRFVSGTHLSGLDVSGENLQQAGVTLAGRWHPAFSSRPVRFGATMKWRSDSSSAQSILFDLGLQQDLLRGKTGGGIAVRNLLSGDAPASPVVPSFGWYYRDAVWGMASADLSFQSGSAYASLGAEKSFYHGLMTVRAGYSGSVRSFLTAGLSCYLWPVGFDTSFSWPTADKQAGSYQFALRYRFGGEDFSETYLNKATEKSVVLERRIRRLEARYREMAEGTGLNPDWSRYEEEPAAPPAPRKREAAVAAPEQKKTAPAAEKKAEAPVVPAVQAGDEAAAAPERKLPAAVPAYARSESKAAPAAWPRRHRVVLGDSLRGLAKRYYQDPNKWQLIYKVNQDKMERGQPQIGTELTIPEP